MNSFLTEFLFFYDLNLPKDWFHRSAPCWTHLQLSHNFPSSYWYLQELPFHLQVLEVPEGQVSLAILWGQLILQGHAPQESPVGRKRRRGALIAASSFTHAQTEKSKLFIHVCAHLMG